MIDMEMFPPWTTMVAIDCVVIVAAVALTILFLRNRKQITAAGGGAGVGLTSFGFWVISFLYLYDLYTMLVLPTSVGPEKAMQEMVRLHVYYSWYVHLIGMGFVVAGVVTSIISVLRHLELLGEARVRAETASTAKSAFLGNMSHELRTPLNAILGFSQLISNGLAANKADKCQEYAHIIFTSGQHLLSLVQDLLDLSRIEAGRLKLDLEDINLSAFIEDIVALMREEADKRGLTLTCDVEDGLMAIKADRRAAKQVILNLLSNAYKHTPAGGAVKISGARLDGGGVSISVVDNGSGIPEDVMNRLFMLYSTTDAVAEGNAQGYGLGLALSKELIEAHGGTIEITSTLGQGTVAMITLPAVPSSAKEAA